MVGFDNGSCALDSGGVQETDVVLPQTDNNPVAGEEIQRSMAVCGDSNEKTDVSALERAHSDITVDASILVNQPHQHAFEDLSMKRKRVTTENKPESDVIFQSNGKKRLGQAEIERTAKHEVETPEANECERKADLILSQSGSCPDVAEFQIKIEVGRDLETTDNGDNECFGEKDYSETVMNNDVVMQDIGVLEDEEKQIQADLTLIQKTSMQEEGNRKLMGRGLCCGGRRNVTIADAEDHDAKEKLNLLFSDLKDDHTQPGLELENVGKKELDSGSLKEGSVDISEDSESVETEKTDKHSLDATIPEEVDGACELEKNISQDSGVENRNIECSGEDSQSSKLKLIQKSRSTRTTSGTKKNSWGSVDVLQPHNKSNEKRLPKNSKKRRRNEMSSDGDMEWEALTGEKRPSTRKSTRTRNSVSLVQFAQDLNGDVAAVTMGLQVSTPSPAERVRFKDFLKRRSGLQEYLEYRNMILGLWERDVCHVLPITDCGVSSVASVEENSRASLIREIYDFLNYHAYINLGITSGKLQTTSVSGQPTESFISLEGSITSDPMDEDEKPLFSGSTFQSHDQNISELPDSLDDESLLDIVNRIKAKNKKKKAILQTSGKTSGEPGVQGLLMCMNEQSSKETLSNCKELENDKTIKVEIEECNSIKKESQGSCLSSIVIRNQDISDPADELSKSESLLKEAVCCDHKTPDDRVVSIIPKDDGLYVKESSDRNLETSEGTGPETKDHKAQVCTIDSNNVPNGTLDVPSEQGNKTDHRRVIIVGAGPSGLIAGRHLQNMGVNVTILEARHRVGGRVCTERSIFSGPVDLGASIITGVEADVATERRPDPSALICKQLKLELTTLGGECPLFDVVTGSKVPAEIDEALEAEYNSLLDDTILLVAQKGDVAMQMSLEEGLEVALKKRREQGKKSNAQSSRTHKSQTADDSIAADQSFLDRTIDNSSLERRVMDWHIANLEYGCAADLSRVSLPYWNQDDVYGGFAGPHCMIKGGYSTVMEGLGDGLTIKLGKIVSKVEYSRKDEQTNSGERVKIHTKDGDVFLGDAVLITVPLGCLKAGSIEFLPPLPDWKVASIQRLGFGVLNKVIMEFPHVFWDENVDFFGATAEKPEMRGRCFMFWNLKRTVGAPVLSALVAGKAAIQEEKKEECESIEHALTVLKQLFGEAAVPQPTAYTVTRWGSDPFSRGAYSFVAIGASGEDYDIIGRSVENSVFFAGEATCKEHPDTVGGAMMSGLREAVRITDVLYSRSDSVAEAEAIIATERHSDTERNEVRDMSKRLAAVELSIAIRKDGGKVEEEDKPINKAVLLEEMFKSAKTISGRLLLAKEMLQLPAASLKSFAGSREGLAVLNNWIKDSMGKDGTQLLRQCVRLLMVVGKDLTSVRQSGIGRTVKEKVIVHTSRDIRAVASQLVNLWMEMFLRGKAANGVAKPLRQPPLTAEVKVRVNNKDSKSVTDSKDKAPSHALPKHTSPEKESRSSYSSNFESVILDTNKKAATLECIEGNQTVELSVPISESEAAALAAAEAARAAAEAAVKAYQTAAANSQLELPKILSFHKFAKREHTAIPDTNRKRSLERDMLLLHGKGKVTTGVDARNCKVRDWSIDFSDSCSYLGSPSTLAATEARSDNSVFIENVKDMPGTHLQTEIVIEKDTRNSQKTEESQLDICIKSPPVSKECSFTQQTVVTNTSSHDGSGHSGRSSEHKKAVTDYISTLLLPLYKTRKIDKDGYKSIVKKSAVKVIERQTEQEAAMHVSEFLDAKRKVKIRMLVDKFVERYLENGGK